MPIYQQCDHLPRKIERDYCKQLLKGLGISSDQQITVNSNIEGSREYLSEGESGLVISTVNGGGSGAPLQIHIDGISEELPKVVKVREPGASSTEISNRQNQGNFPEGDYALVELRALGQKKQDLIITFADHQSISERKSREVEVSGNFSMAVTNTTDTGSSGGISTWSPYAHVGLAMVPISQLAGWVLWGVHYYDYYVRKEEALIECHSVTSYLLTWSFSFWVELVVYQCKKPGLPGVFSH